MNSSPISPRLRATRGFAALSVSALVLAGCGSDPGADPAAAGSGDADAISVLATTTVWGDIARQVVSCAGTGEVTTLMPVGADPHDYSPSAQDVAQMVGADLVIANGLGLEGGLTSSLASAAQDGATVFEVAPLLDPIPFGGHTDGASAGDASAEAGQDHEGEDPHVFHDVARVATAAQLIGAKLTELSGDAAFTTCGDTLRDELMTVDAQVAAILAEVPADRRILVTDHDALGYLADAYGYTVAGTVIPGGSTMAAPSSAELAALAGTIRQTGVPAIFANTADSQVLVDALAAEVGEVEVVALFVGSLGGPGSGAQDYQGMVTTNAQRISTALGG
ncbi:MAG: metal ABC transporter substrate-binding protein [Candidatus Nanopelagicales bacterium]